MAHTLWIDAETYNERPIEVGTYAYGETAEVLLLQWAWNDGPVHVWDAHDGAPMPDLRGWAEDPDVIFTAHHAMFDRTVLRLGDWKADIPASRWDCTMTQALQHALPAGLAQLGQILGLPADQQKLKEGKALIHRFCKPAPRNHNARRYSRDTHPVEWQRFVDYGIQDIDAMRACARRMPAWNWQADDRAMWILDQQINDRGFAADVDLATAGAWAAIREGEALAEEFAALTGGLKPTQRDRVRDFINAKYGLNLGGTAKHFLQPITKNPSTPRELNRLCELIVDANKTSTAKYGKLRQSVSADGRFRGGLQFAGASRTRRWAGRNFQPQNLPSRGLPSAELIVAYIKALKAGVHTGLFPNPMLYGAAALRGLVVSPPAKRLSASDLSNIEGRLVAWLAGEHWKLKAFQDFDAGVGPDLYNVTAASIIGGDPWSMPGSDRNAFGKVPELAFGFGGGVGAMQTFAKAYSVKMYDYWDTICANMEARFIDRARANFDKWGHRDFNPAELTVDEWIASETVKLAWRERHAATRQLWYDLESAAANAITTPGHWFQAGAHLWFISVDCGGHRYLLMRLPSGKFLTYFNPRQDASGDIWYEGYADIPGRPGQKIWSDISIYGGKFLENAAQSLAGDVLKYNMPLAEKCGYEIVLTVHDEIVAEVPDSCPPEAWRGLAKIMATVPHWAPGLPLAASGFDDYRYRKG